MIDYGPPNYRSLGLRAPEGHVGCQVSWQKGKQKIQHYGLGILWDLQGVLYYMVLSQGNCMGMIRDTIRS